MDVLIYCAAVLLAVIVLGRFDWAALMARAVRLCAPVEPLRLPDEYDKELKAFEEQAEHAIKGIIWLDASRKAVLYECIDTLALLLAGKMDMTDGYRKVLLGRKGVGKTRLLKEIQTQAQAMFRQNGLLCAWVSYNDQNHAMTPLHQAISTYGLIPRVVSYLLMKCTVTTEHYVAAVEGFLLICGYRLFVVVDELQNVFHGRCAAGPDILNELRVLGASQRGACHWILSGSSEYLRGLVTGQHSIKDMHAQGFTHYMRDDLNGRKFVPTPIFPFLDHTDFVGLVSLYKQSGLTDDDLARLYLKSGAVPGNVINLLKSKNSQINTWGVSPKGLGHTAATDESSIVLRAVAKLTESYIANSWNDNDTDLISFCKWTRPIAYPDVLRSALALGDEAESKTMTAEAVEKVCYKLSDRGILCYDVSQQPSTVRLGSPSILMQLRSITTSLTPDEVVALLHSNQNNNRDLAARVALRTLANAARQTTSHDVNQIFGFTIDASEVDVHGTLHVGNPNMRWKTSDVVNRVWKEMYSSKGQNARDALGADGVVLTLNGDELVAHRIQVKMGKGRVEKKDASTITERFSLMMATTKEAYARSGLPLSKTRSILFTVKDILPEARTHLTDNNIEVWDGQFLAKHVWTPQIKSISPLFQE